MMTEQPIPTTSIAGFLGAVKTTLINHILHSQPEKRFAILVHDLGSVNVDAELVEGEEENLVSLAKGCICYSIAVIYRKL